MKTNVPLLKKILPAIGFTCCVFSAAAQEPTGGPQLSVAYLDDSLTRSSEKTTDGYYYKGFPVTVESGARLYINYSSFGPGFRHLSLALINSEAGKTARYYCKEIAGSCLGSIELDTVFTSAATVNILFTTDSPGEVFSFTANAFYASPAAMNYNNNADFCWKIAFILKHSDNGYRFITGEKGKGFMSTNATTAPLLAESPQSSSIVSGLTSIDYKSILGRGTREEADAFYKQLEQTLRQCLGAEFEYKTVTSEAGLPQLTCTASAETKDALVRNLNYVTDKTAGVKPKYIITATETEKTVSGSKVYEVGININNAFYQY